MIKKENINLIIQEFNSNDFGDILLENGINNLINQKGVIIIRNVFEVELINELRKNLQECIDEDEIKYSKEYIFYGMVHALMIRRKCFQNVLNDSLVMNIMRNILGHGAIVHAFNSSSLPPFSTNFAGKIHVDSPRLIPGYITNVVMTIALDDFTNENGAMEIWPSSFNQYIAPTDKEFEKNRIILDTLKAGDLVLFNARCWHKGGVNTTEKWRHAIAITGCRSYMRQQFDFPSMFKKEDELLFSDSFKQFLGYHVRTPKKIEEFLLPPNERLYKMGQE